MKANLKMVAEKAGVSKSAVSLCLNNHPMAARISQATKDRIIQAVKDCNYHPNFSARSLSCGRTNSIGLVVADLRIQRQARIAAQMMAHAEVKHYSLLISSTRFSPELELDSIQNLRNRQVDGVIFQFGSLLPETTVYQQLKKEKFPLVKLFHRDDYFPFVINIFRAAIEEAAAKLAEAGLRTVYGLMAPDANENRDVIFLECCAKHGLEGKLLKPDFQTFSYSDRLLEEYAQKRDCGFIIHSYYNLLRFLQFEPQGVKIIPILDDFCDRIEHHQKLFAGVILGRGKKIVDYAVDLLLERIVSPAKTGVLEHHVEGAFVSLDYFNRQIDDDNDFLRYM